MYIYNIDLILGSAKSNLDLYANLVDLDNNIVESGITNGFKEYGGGIYSFSHTIPLDFQGSIQFFELDTTTPLTSVSVQPSLSLISGYIQDSAEPIKSVLDSINNNLPTGYSSELDAYISGVVSTINSYSALYDIYISGQSDKIILLNNYISGLTSLINSYNKDLDLYISGLAESTFSYTQSFPYHFNLLESGIELIINETPNNFKFLNIDSDGSIVSVQDVLNKSGYIFSEIPNVNVTQWMGSTPSTLDVNGYLPANILSIGDDINRLSEFANLIDNQYIPNLLNSTLYISGYLGKPIIVNPAISYTNKRIEGTSLLFYTNEVKSTQVSVYDQSGSPIELPNNLKMHIDSVNTANRYLIDVDVSGNTFSFTNPSELTKEAGIFKWSLRYNTEVITYGLIKIEDAAYVEE